MHTTHDLMSSSSSSFVAFFTPHQPAITQLPLQTLRGRLRLRENSRLELRWFFLRVRFCCYLGNTFVSMLSMTKMSTRLLRLETKARFNQIQKVCFKTSSCSCTYSRVHLILLFCSCSHSLSDCVLVQTFSIRKTIKGFFKGQFKWKGDTQTQAKWLNSIHF